MARPKGPERRRVQVTLSAESWAMVEQVAEYLEQPKAAILAELFEEVLPALAKTVDAIRLAKAGQAREAQRIVTNFGAGAVMTLQQATLDLDQAITEREKKKKGKRRRGSDGPT